MEAKRPPAGLGSCLVAAPMLMDPNFRRTVVLLCEFGPEGAFGLVLNRRLDVTPGELVDDLSGIDVPVGFGGPVRIETLHYVHRLGQAVSGAIRLTDDLWWGGDFEALGEEMASDNGAAERVRFYLGYAGWGAGQLESEIAEGGWITAPASASVVFTEDPDTMWRTVLRDLGGMYAMMANFPDDPRLN